MQANWWEKDWWQYYGGYNVKEKNTIRTAAAAFLITLCVAGAAGGFAVVQNTAMANSISFPPRAQKVKEQEKEAWLVLPPRWQALLAVTRLQEWLWEYYFTVLAKP